MSKIQIVQTMSDEIEEDSCWTASFNLTWNKFKSEYLSNDFTCKSNDEDIKNLINFNQDNIVFNDKVAFNEVQKASPEFKEKIEEFINENFDGEINDESVLKKVDFDNSEDLVLCSIHEFLLDFEIAYENMNIKKFGNYKRNIEFFGFIQNYTKYNEQIIPLFYHDKNNFAVSLYSTSNQTIVLYRTDLEDTFENVFKHLQTKIDEASVGEYSLSISSFACPKIKVEINKNYKNLCGKKFIRNSDEKEIKVANAISSFKLDLNKDGIKSKEDDTLSLNELDCYGQTLQTNFRDFIFNDNFYMFIFDEDSIGFDNPIGAVKVKNIQKFLD